MLGSILSLWLTFSLAPAKAAPADDAAELDEARRLYDEGAARYEAADFAGAIEVFTLALGKLNEADVRDFGIRGALLFNIGRSHMRAFEINREVEHLRQAKSIFTTFVEGAEKHADQVDPADIDEARSQLEAIDELLASAAEGPGPSPDPAPDPAPDQAPDRDAGDPKRLRASGIGLTVAGAALVGGGVGMLAWGAGFGANAQSQVDPLDDLGLPADSPAFAESDAFVAAERRKGTAWMAAGGVTAAIGVVGVALGVRQLVRAKRAREQQVTPVASFGPGGVWLGVSGQF